MTEGDWLAYLLYLLVSKNFTDIFTKIRIAHYSEHVGR